MLESVAGTNQYYRNAGKVFSSGKKTEAFDRVWTHKWLITHCATPPFINRKHIKTIYFNRIMYTVMIQKQNFVWVREQNLWHFLVYY